MAQPFLSAKPTPEAARISKKIRRIARAKPRRLKEQEKPNAEYEPYKPQASYQRVPSNRETH